VDRLSRDEKRAAQAAFRGEEPGKGPCQWCGGLHVRTLLQPPAPSGASPPVGVQYEAACPRVRKLEFHANSNLVSVEFFGVYDETGIVFPEDAFDDEDGEEPG
jgi:hypothetical protein